MASRRAVVAALKMFSLTFAGDVSDERIDLYAAALEDVTDNALKAATTQLVKTHRGEWIPVPAVIREAAGANAKPRVDVAGILKQLHALVDYNPVSGHSAPRVETVRRRISDGVADAYGAIGGGDRLLMSDGTTRAIAERDFAKELVSIVAERGPACLALPAAAPLKQLTA
jgi:hypothetical protein